MDAITMMLPLSATLPKTKAQLQAHGGLTFCQTLASEQSKKDAPVDILSKIAEGKPDFSHMTKRDIVANINARYDSEIEKHYGTLVGVELKQTRSKEWDEAGISTAERQEIERELYIAANGFESFSDDEIKVAILDKYGHANSLTEREFRQMENELMTAGVSKKTLASVMLPSVQHERQAMIRMQLSGTYSDAAKETWMSSHPTSDEKINWMDYFNDMLRQYRGRNADADSIAAIENVIQAITVS